MEARFKRYYRRTGGEISRVDSSFCRCMADIRTYDTNMIAYDKRV